MGSVQSEMKCPQCGGVLFSDYYYMTDEEYLICLSCEKKEKWTLVRDDKKQVIIKKNGKAKYKHIRHKGYGCGCISFLDGGSELSSLRKPLRKKDKDEFLRIINSEKVNKEKSYLTRWDEKTKTLVAVYGKFPKYGEHELDDYEDQEGE